jgi:hypothetical protein
VRAWLVSLLLLGSLGTAEAGPRRACLERLDALRVPYRPAKLRRGIETPVEVIGPLGGVTYTTWSRKPLVLDCSLVYSLALAGRYLMEAGLTKALYSSAYQRRNVRGTSKLSRHSFGLAIDVHELGGLRVSDDYEQGLGDAVDCIGAPLTEGGSRLRTVLCRMERSGLFRIVLSPDYDEDHWNHFHVEALPWGERQDLRRDAAIDRTRTPAMIPRDAAIGIR